ncbi:hypothetical protein RFI_16930, partial [Reticulomyxa filosa]
KKGPLMNRFLFVCLDRFWTDLKTYNMTFRRLLSDRIGALINVLVVVFGMLFIAHIVGCGWYALGKRSGHYSWIDAKNYGRKPTKFMYIVSLYWAVVTLSTTGFGDITPQNEKETAFSTLVVFIGTCIFAYLIGQTGAFVSSINRSTAQMNERLNEAYVMLCYVYIICIFY